MPGRTSDGLDGASSRKRGPAHVRDSDDDDDDVQHVRSDVRAEGRKRVRLSDAADLEEDEQDYNPSDDEHERRPRQTQKTPQKSQYELMRDNNFEHLRHELADDQRATQRLRSRPILLGENAIAENGIIESVTCVNFMCHSRLHCELGPLLNFIVGENGSGKSAILTAITLCLGGKASSTNRGGSLKSFVKEGCDKAMLAVKIKNRGQDAYKPELYGESVIVERHFSKSGVSGFRVKSATDRVVSIKKQEVDELVEYYALQVDNPLNILSQDNARQFLNASSKQQKYKFFIEGVQLQQLDNDYRLIAESLEGMVAKVPDQEEHVKHAKAALEKAQRRMRELEGAKTLRDQGRLLRLQILWKQVEELEEELAARQRAVAEVETKIAEAQQNIDAKDRVIEAATEKIQRYETALENMKAEEAELQRQKEEVMSRALEIEQEVAELQTQHREAQQELKMKNEHAADIKQRIQEEEQRLRDTNGKEQAEAIRNMDAAKAEIARIEDAIREAKEKEPQLKETQKKAEEALREIEGQVKTKRDERAKVEAAIKKLEESHGNILQSYEAGMPRLLHAIANETRFQTKPIGPLGMHIRLLKPEWTGILETTFGNNLNAFLVRNKHDERLLNDMMSRLNIRESPILITNPFSLDLTGKEPDPEYDTILRALEFDDQAVRDQLILLFSIEQIILVPNRIRAQEIMFDGAPPRNVQACLCFHDTKREGIRLVNRGSMSSSPVVPNLGQRPRMKTDDEYQILMHRDTLKQLQAEYAQIDGEWRRRQQEVSHCRREVLKLKAEREKLEAERPKAQNRVDECEAELDKFDGSDARLRNYQKQLAEVEQIIKETLGPQYGELTMKYEEKTDILNQVHAEVKAAEEKLKDWGKRQRAIVDKLGRVKDLLNLTIGEKNAFIASFAGLEEAKREAEGKVERQAQRVEIHKAKVHEISPHRVAVDPNVSLKTLDNQYNEILGLLEKMKHRAGMDEQQAHAALEEAARNYEKAKHELASTQEINRKLRHSLTLRLEKWRKFQRYISSQSRANFIYLLSERGFRGKLLLDHEAKSLDLQVEPDKTEKRAAGRSTKTLSGGEKSFASICLLLAIWEAMGSPLRCLDEFDVFMDNVNRAISTNMLITAARRSVNRQYIFITPNAIEGRMSLDKDVKIIRLTDPRQRTLTDRH